MASASASTSAIDDIESVRIQLEENVKKLQDLVKHWRTWEAEYEGLKEGLADLNEGSSEDEIVVAADDCVGELLTRDEITSLTHDKNSKQIRGLAQILRLIDRRIEYVQANVASMEKRLSVEQDKFDEVNLLGYTDEEGLPLMEIMEELDEDDNVVSSSVRAPRDAAPQLLDVLRKGGIEDLSELKNDDTKQQDKNLEQNVKEAGDVKVAPEPKLEKKKGVTFREQPQVREISEPEGPATERKVRFAEAIEVSQSQPIEDPVIPENESEEEAALRREMLEYNMRKIGTIVAEIDLDEGADEETDDEEDDIDEDESEDEYGRTTTQVISDQYREKMLELEKKLNARGMINVGPEIKDGQIEEEVSQLPIQEPAQQPQQAVVEDEGQGKTAKSKQSKGVRFAEDLDIQEHPTVTTTSIKESVRIQPVATPIKDEIVERRPSENDGLNPAKKKVSRFKANRLDASEASRPEVITNTRPPKGDNLYPAEPRTTSRAGNSSHSSSKILNTAILERPPVDDQQIPEPDSLDPELHNAEVRNAYHEMRNKLIQRENGFMDQDMDEYEDEHGKPQVSRFMAARLARQREDGRR